MGVIHDDRRFARLEDVETPRHLWRIATKRRQSGPNVVERHVQRPDGCTSGLDVLDLKPDLAAMSQRHALKRSQHLLTLSLGKHDLTGTDKNRPLTASTVSCQDRMLPVGGKEDDTPWTMPGHLRH